MPLADPIFRRLRLVRSEDGFGLVEALFAMVIFAIVASALATVLTAATAAHSYSRVRTLAQQAAMAQVEYIRGLTYDKVGTNPGNPLGTIAPTRTVSLAGVGATVTTDVRWIAHDGTPTSYSTNAFYKKVTVTVTRTRDGRQLAREVTFFSPPDRAPLGGVNLASVDPTVVDLVTRNPLVGATVSLKLNGVLNAQDTAGLDGKVSFAGLDTTSTNWYDVVVDNAPYVTLAADAPPNGIAHFQLAGGEDKQPVIELFKPVSLSVVLQDQGTGLAFAGTANVTVSSTPPGTSGTFSVTGGTSSAITSLSGGAQVLPTVDYTVSTALQSQPCRPQPADVPVPSLDTNGYPDTLSSTATVLVPAALATQNVTVHVIKKGSTTLAASGATVTASGGPLPGCGTATATTNSSGDATLTLPAGAGYKISATASGGSTNGAGSWPTSGTASLPVTPNPSIQLK
jgi:type II secretory pathway pseudopilin PulG